MLLFALNLAGTKLISCVAVVHLMKYICSMHNKACHNMKNTHRTLIKTLLDFNTVICGHLRSGQIGEATRVFASYLYDCSQTVQTLHSPNYLFN